MNIKTIEEFNSRLNQTIGGANRLTNFIFKDNEEFELEITIANANTVEFIGCVFHEKVTFKSTFDQDVWIKDCTFHKEAIFENCIFSKNVRFYGTEFLGATNFRNTKFENLADFWTAQFHKNTIYYKTNFEGTTVFAGTIFHSNVLFTYSLIEKVVIFRNTEFKKGLDLSLAILPNGSQISWFDNKVQNFKSINDVEDIYTLGDNVEIDGDITHKHKRETFRIIKSQLNNSHNYIDSSNFYGMELKAYEKQLISEFIYKGKIVNIIDLIVLWFNKYSSDHGKNWVLGLIFVISVSLLFFYYSILNTEGFKDGIIVLEDSYCQDKALKYYLNFLIPFHDFDLLREESPNKYSYLYDFIGRIFVGYGIYQLIQSFRKYKSK